LAANKPRRNAPFIVGVSGHRDLHPEGVARVRGAVTAFVYELKQHLLDTELRVIVGMAEGADLLVAQTVLELGLGVDAVLPMPLDKYAADFDAETSVAAGLLRRLMSCASNCRCRRSDDAAIGTLAHCNAPYANLTDALI
jgi:hypothetical protein